MIFSLLKTMKYYIVCDSESCKIYLDGSELTDDCSSYSTFDCATFEFYACNDKSVMSGVIEGNKITLDACSDVEVKQFIVPDSDIEMLHSLRTRPVKYRSVLFDLHESFMKLLEKPITSNEITLF